MKLVVTDVLEPWVGRWPDSERGPWQVTLTWRWFEGRAECSGFALAPVDETCNPISATLLRKVPLMRLVADARRQRFEDAGGALLEALDDGQDIDLSRRLEESLRASSASWEPRRPGRPATLSREHYNDVAQVYSAAHVLGAPPLVAVQQRWHVARPTASRWVAAARSLDLLPATDKGRARGNAAPAEAEQVTS